jgi:hypothetical protein
VARVTERIAVETGVTEILQPAEILRGELIVRELRVRQVMCEVRVRCGSAQRRTSADCAGSARKNPVRVLMAERACARLAGETVACPAECAVRHCLSGNAASAKVASGESVGTARVEAMEAWRATAHPEAAAMRRGRVETAARMEAATTHAHPAATHVEAATTATMESAAAPAASAAATAATPGGQRIGRRSGDHSYAGQKCQGKFALHVTRLLEASCAACIRDTCPKLKLREGRSNFRVRQLILREVAVRYAEQRRGRQIEDVFLFAGTVEGRA